MPEVQAQKGLGGQGERPHPLREARLLVSISFCCSLPPPGSTNFSQTDNVTILRILKTS